MTSKHAALALVAALSAGQALAANTSTTTEKELGLLDKVSLGNLTYAIGPSLAEPLNSQTVNADGEKDGAIYLKNYTTLGYKVGESTKVYTQPVWVAEITRGGSLSMKDQRVIGISDSKLINSGKFNLYANATLEMPLYRWNDTSRLIAPGSFQITSYTLGKFTVGTYTAARAYTYRGAGGTDTQDLALYFEPYVNYTFNDTVGIEAGYEMDAKHSRGTNLLTASNWLADGTEAHLGVPITAISGKLDIQPYLSFHPTGANGVQMDTTCANVAVTITAL